MVYIHKRREIEFNKDNTVLCFRTRMNIKHTFEGYEGLSASVNVGRFQVHLLNQQCEPPLRLEHFLLHFRGYFDGEWNLLPLHHLLELHRSVRFRRVSHASLHVYRSVDRRLCIYTGFCTGVFRHHFQCFHFSMRFL